MSKFEPLLDSYPTPNLENHLLFNILQWHNVHTKFCDNALHCTKMGIGNTQYMSSSSIVKSQATVHDSRMNKYHIFSLKCQLRRLEDSLTCTLVKCDKTKILIRTTFRLICSVHHLIFQSAMTHFFFLFPSHHTTRQVLKLTHFYPKDTVFYFISPVLIY